MKHCEADKLQKIFVTQKIISMAVGLILGWTVVLKVE